MKSFLDYKKIFDVDFGQVLFETLNTPEIKKDIIDLNQKDQLAQGIDSKENVIETISSQEQKSGFPYSTFTVSSRAKKGLQVRKVDLRDTGQFWNTFNVEVTKNTTEVLANFNKGSNDIRDNFDSKYDFLGLTNNNLENITWSSIFPSFSNKLRKLLKL